MWLAWLIQCNAAKLLLIQLVESCFVLVVLQRVLNVDVLRSHVVLEKALKILYSNVMFFAVMSMNRLVESSICSSVVLSEEVSNILHALVYYVTSCISSGDICATRDIQTVILK
jgi:hypothetical protein